MTIAADAQDASAASAVQPADGRGADRDALQGDLPGTAKARRWHGAS
jgi:hypothetical protein